MRTGAFLLVSKKLCSGVKAPYKQEALKLNLTKVLYLYDLGQLSLEENSASENLFITR